MNSNNLDKNNILNLYKEKNYNSFIKSGLKLLKKNPKNYQLTYLIGLSYVNLQKYAEAEKYFDKLLNVQKKPEIFFIQANIHKQLKKYDTAITYFEEAIQLNPNFSEAYNNLGNIKKRIGKIEEAISCFKKAIELKENNILAYFNLANTYRENRYFNELIETYEKILSFNPNDIKTLYNLGSAYLFLGEISKGKNFFEKIIKINKNHVPSYRNIISVTKITKENEIFKQLELLKVDVFSDEDKILFYDALSKGYFDQDNDKLGFKYLDKSNSLKKKNSKFSFEKTEKQFKQIKNFFENVNKIEIDFKDVLRSRPIFIVGMPRSGTSLVEQILSSHKEVFGGGELPFLEIEINKILSKFQKNNDLKKDDIKDLIMNSKNEYFEKISNYDSSYKVFTDKAPLNFRFIGFIRYLFPNAKIINCNRDPLDIIWSNFKNYFSNSLPFTNDLEDIGNYYKLYEDLMIFWRGKIPNFIYDIEYSGLVENPKLEIKKLLSFCELSWDENCLNHHKNERAIKTASSTQARKPIYKTGIKSSDRYKDYLKDVKTIIESK